MHDQAAISKIAKAWSAEMGSLGVDYPLLQVTTLMHGWYRATLTCWGSTLPGGEVRWHILAQGKAPTWQQAIEMALHRMDPLRFYVPRHRASVDVRLGTVQAFQESLG